MWETWRALGGWRFFVFCLCAGQLSSTIGRLLFPGNRAAILAFSVLLAFGAASTWAKWVRRHRP